MTNKNEMPDAVWVSSAGVDILNGNKRHNAFIQPTSGYQTKYTRAAQPQPPANKQAALDAITKKIGIAGNHLGLCIGVDHPFYTADANDVLEQMGAGPAYETWVAWKLIYEAYVELERMCERSALTQPQPPVIEGLSDYILKPELPDYIRDLDIIATYGNEPERIARIKSFIETIRLYAQGQTAQPVDLIEREQLIEIVEGLKGSMEHGAWRDEHGKRLKDTPEWVKFYNASRGMIVTAQQPTEDAQRALELFNDYFSTDPAVKNDEELQGMVKTIRAALARGLGE